MKNVRHFLFLVWTTLISLSAFSQVVKIVGPAIGDAFIQGPLKPNRGSQVLNRMGMHYNACEIGLFQGARINEIEFNLSSSLPNQTLTDVEVRYRNNNRSRMILDEPWLDILQSALIPDCQALVENTADGLKLRIVFLSNGYIDYMGGGLDLFIEYAIAGDIDMQCEAYTSPQGVAVWGSNYFFSYGNSKPLVTFRNSSGSFYPSQGVGLPFNGLIEPCHNQIDFCPHQEICLGIDFVDTTGNYVGFYNPTELSTASFFWEIGNAYGSYDFTTTSPQLAIPPDLLHEDSIYIVSCQATGILANSTILNYTLKIGDDLDCNDAFGSESTEDGSRITKVVLSKKNSASDVGLYDELLISQTQGADGVSNGFFNVQSRNNALGVFQTVTTTASFIQANVNYTRTDFARTIAEMPNATPEFLSNDSIKVEVTMNKRAKPMMNHRIRVRFDFDGNGSYESEKILNPTMGNPVFDIPNNVNQFMEYILSGASSTILYTGYFLVPCNVRGDKNVRFEVVLKKLPTGWNDQEEYTIKTLCPTPIINYAGGDTVCISDVLPMVASVPAGCVGIYKWYDSNDSLVYTGSSFTPDTSGTYTVKFITEDCEKSSIPVTIVVLPLIHQYVDADGDGFGNPLVDTLSCDTIAGYVLNHTDCNDANANVYPGALEICNGVDDDCDDEVDEGLSFVNYFNDVDGDNYGAGAATNACQSPGASYVTNNTDCDDTNPLLNSISVETCNSFDDDCDGLVDDGLSFVNYYNDADGDTYGAGTATNACQSPGANYVINNTDCNDATNMVNPSVTETCNSIDDDCDGLTDEGCATGSLIAATQITSLPQFGLTGGNYSQNVNMSSQTDTPEYGGTYPEKWFKFVAQSNAVRIAVTGASSADDNAIAIYDDPGLSYTTPLIPIDVADAVNLSSTGVTDQGNEILLTDQLIEGNTYYVAVATVNGTAGNINVKFNTLLPSTCDIASYTGGTNTYSNVCSNFKCRYRTNAKQAVVHRWPSNVVAGAPLQSHTIPPTTIMFTVCQLSKFVPANISGSPQTIYVSADVQYELPDAAGVIHYLTAVSTSTCQFTLNAEASINLRSTDACPNFKTTMSSLATDRSVCGTSQYQWEFTMAYPSPGLPTNVSGSVGGSRILAASSIPGIANGQRYDVRIRALHNDAVTYSGWTVSPSCFKTLGAAGMVPWSSTDEQKVDFDSDLVSLYPNPSMQGKGALLKSSDEIESIQIFNSSGQLLARVNGTIEKGLLELPAMADAGLYWVVVKSGNNIQRMAWLVQ